MRSLIALLGWFIYGVLGRTRPVIGILTVPSELDNYSQTNYSTLSATYVKYIESAGAIVIPIPWDANYTELEFIVNRVNGILFTGGDTLIYLNETQPGFEYNKFTDTVSFLINKAIMHNKINNTFPIFGICQGFQILNYVISNYYPVLQRVYDNEQKQRLFTYTDKNNYLFKGMSEQVEEYITSYIGPFEYNNWAVFDETYQKAQTLNAFFNILGYSMDELNQEFIAAVEGKEYPFYAVQFHPEKHQFEFNSPANHTKELVEFGQLLVRNFVSKARLNENIMDQEEIFKRAIWQYNPEFVDLYYEAQTYVFKRVQIQDILEKKELGIKLMEKYFYLHGHN